MINGRKLMLPRSPGAPVWQIVQRVAHHYATGRRPPLSLRSPVQSGGGAAHRGNALDVLEAAVARRRCSATGESAMALRLRERGKP